MKKLFCTVALVCFLFMTGCGRSREIVNLTSQLQKDVPDTTVFVSGMGCSALDCTDLSHYHDCPPDCGDYDHHHYCDLDCTEASHHHADTPLEDNQYAEPTVAANVSFVSGMGCSDSDCTDMSHHHDCPPDCADYDHYHNCGLDCTEVGHHHCAARGVNGFGHHHSRQHHGGNHY